MPVGCDRCATAACRCAGTDSYVRNYITLRGQIELSSVQMQTDELSVSHRLSDIVGEPQVMHEWPFEELNGCLDASAQIVLRSRVEVFRSSTNNKY